MSGLQKSAGLNDNETQLLNDQIMRTYIRSHSQGGVYFFTVNLAQRKPNDLLVRHVDDLRQAFRYTKQRHPLIIEAIVVLPEDDDYPLRWHLIKSQFSRHIERTEKYPTVGCVK